jgi:TonB family protein
MFAAQAVDSVPPAAGVTQPITKPEWIRRPSGDDMARAYPFMAQQKGLGGRAVLVCTVTQQGTLSECSAVDGDPMGQGFADGVLRLQKLFQMKAKDGDGLEVAGRAVRIPIRFALPQGIDVRVPEFDGAWACYGQVANAAEENPFAPGAWQATAYWNLQLSAAVAKGPGRPSEAEDLARQARLAAAAHSMTVPAGFELQACMAKALR